MSTVINLFQSKASLDHNIINLDLDAAGDNQVQTNDIFSSKWAKVEEEDDVGALEKFQKEWYLSLYGFSSEKDLKEFLSTKEFILDAGCGLGYKAAWFAELAPNSTVIGMDFSEAAYIAAGKYKHLTNLFFVQGDISDSQIKEGVIDYVSCDQVIMHTNDPIQTFAHLTSITKTGGEFACYVYAKKALPRELIDDYFRKATHTIDEKDLWDLSEQLTELGKRLTDLNVQFDCPDIPLLGIKGGRIDVQRFIYWNFLKCFWREDWGKELCDSTNFDWYSPSNAMRFSQVEFEQMIRNNKLNINHFHSEEACYSGRFIKVE